MALWKTLNNHVLFTLACKILCNTCTRMYKIQAKLSRKWPPWKAKKKSKQFSSQCSTISVIAWLFGRFPGFARLSYWYEQHVDVEYGALVELYRTGEKRSISRNIFPNASLSNKNPVWPGLGSKPGLRGERPATNRLSHGTAPENWI